MLSTDSVTKYLDSVTMADVRLISLLIMAMRNGSANELRLDAPAHGNELMPAAPQPDRKVGPVMSVSRK
jgi:hypothetical protein